MPEWAENDAGNDWEAADEHERANGRLYSEVQFALPKELNEDERREAASSFAERLTGGERLPYTLAIHRGGTNGENPHAHLMFSERGNDGIERSGEQWFKRHNAKAPEKGGARKSRAAKAGDWLEQTRKAWEQTANRALERAAGPSGSTGAAWADLRDEAHRAGDLKRAAELSREPNVHLGPERYRTSRGGASETVQQAGRVERRTAADRGERDADSRKVERLEREIAGVEARLKETYDRVEQRLTNEFGKLAEQYAQEQKRLSEQVEQLAEQMKQLAEQHADEVGRYIEWSKTLGERVTHLGEQVQTLAEQHADELKGYVGWSEHMGEQHGRLNAHVEKLTKAYNELARLLDEG